MLQLNQLESVQLTPIEDSINQEREKAAESARLKNIQIPLRRILSFVVWYGMVAYFHLWYGMVWLHTFIRELSIAQFVL